MVWCGVVLVGQAALRDVFSCSLCLSLCAGSHAKLACQHSSSQPKLLVLSYKTRIEIRLTLL